MGKWVKVAIKGDIPPGESMPAETEIGRIALFNVEGEVFAVEDCCPHAGAPLNQGFVEKGRVICPYHGWSFPLAEDEPLCDGLLRFPVRLEGEDILVELPDDGTRCRT